MTFLTKFLLGISLILLMVQCSAKNNDYSELITRKHASRIPAPPATSSSVSIDECEDYLVLANTSIIAERINRPKKWVKDNYLIPLYADTSQGGQRIIGHAAVGGHCFIVNSAENWFFVQSPGANELGWVHRDFVAGFIKKDPVTLLPCK